MLIDIMTYLKAQIKWKRSHVLTICNAIKMPVRIAACKLPQNRANMALTFFSPFITTQNKNSITGTFAERHPFQLNCRRTKLFFENICLFR